MTSRPRATSLKCYHAEASLGFLGKAFQKPTLTSPVTTSNCLCNLTLLESNNHRSRFTFHDCSWVAVYESSSEGASHSSLTNLRPGHDSGATTTAPTWCHHLPLGKVNCNWGGFRQTFYSSLLFDHFSLCDRTPPPPPSNVRFWLVTFFSRTQYGLGTVY